MAVTVLERALFKSSWTTINHKTVKRLMEFSTNLNSITLELSNKRRLLNKSSLSANTDSICQAKVQSYPWNKQTYLWQFWWSRCYIHILANKSHSWKIHNQIHIKMHSELSKIKQANFELTLWCIILQNTWKIHSNQHKIPI